MTPGGPEAGFAADARPTCGSCGVVYDPTAGDPGREVPPGTPFGGLPDYWRCPGCGGPQHGFTVAVPPGGNAMGTRVAALTASYRLIAERDMAGVPICNAALAVEALGFRPHGPGWIGCITAPWFLNAVLIPRDPALWADRRDGDKVEIDLPSGAYRFTAARAGVLGTLAVIALASAMNVFTDQEDARAAAVLALDHLMREPQPAPQSDRPDASNREATKPALSRRSLFGRARR
ncbi:[NiFe]-hydrogenase assembly chaperone HybE [Azospirillum brasilense]|uniref:[NiFe]-hydrogenase assembly chaperone HybE n=1 Tax=Azospirillum brasilense TaxID=192 RepID=UPI000E687E0E|nr:[NiFe]-hydrogenase assembly chaperone HybE [Azospirillum brasilense]NUB25127.1 [NiFe]-hydrogenase assembly chaperone HybE [Azospirillum brasilense]NUB31370.1 [NiFe]-hydrogenase assembly chaperone HybE [Azospirillum brasilense]RIW07650.1 [NiFe]-hydrogenase assembly, chaperone, HybE [Azospirillum brasilense]